MSPSLVASTGVDATGLQRRYWQAGCMRNPMAVFHLECSIHRRCTSGLSVASEQLAATTSAQAIAEAEARFVALLADRAGSAMLWDDAGQVVWSTRRFTPGSNNSFVDADR